MAVPAERISELTQAAKVTARALEQSGQQAARPGPGAGPGGTFDVWSQTAAAMGDRAVR
jgi:hypothetical protein